MIVSEKGYLIVMHTDKDWGVSDDFHVPTSVALLQRVAEEAAERAVKKTFLVMGVDPENPMASQADFVFLRATRERCQGASGKMIAAVLVVAVGMVASALVVGVRVMLMTGKS